MKIFLTLLLLLFGQSLYSQQHSYNVYEIGKGEIFKDDYFYLGHLYQNLIVGIPFNDGIDYNNVNRTGVIDVNQNVILPFQYKGIEKVRDDWGLKKDNIPLIAISNGKGRALFKLSNNVFEQMTDFAYLSFRPYLFDGNYLHGYNGYSQILNLKGTTVLKTEFIRAEPLTSNLITTSNWNYKWGVINIKGDTILSHQFNDIRRIVSITDTLIRITKNDSIGLLNKNSELIILPIFRRVEISKTRIITQTFNNEKKIEISKTLQKKLSNWTADIKKNGKVYSSINSINNKNIRQLGLFGAFDYDGILKIPFEYTLLETGIGNEIIANKGGKFGVISENGKTIIDFKYNEITKILDTYYLVKNDNNYYGLFTINNKKIFNSEFKKIFPISNNEVLYSKDDFWHKATYSDNFTKSKIEITKLYANYNISYLTNDYKERTDFFAIKGSRHFGIIDNNQKIIVPIVNDVEPKHFDGKFFDLGRKYTINGIELVDIDLSRNYYDDDINLRNTIIGKKGEKYGVVDMKGKSVIPFQYSYIQNIDGNKFIVKK